MRNLKILLPYIYKYKWIILLGFVFVTLSNISSTTIPLITGSAIDTLKTSFNSKTYDSEVLLKQLLYILLLTISSGFFMYWTRRTIIVVSRYIEYDLRKDFLETVMSKPQIFFDKNPTGTLMALATNDISAARDFFGPAIMYGANTLTTFLFSLYFMFSINTEMTIIVLLPMPILAVYVHYIGKKIHKAFKNSQQSYADLTSKAQESFSGIRIIKAYSRAAYEVKEFDKNNTDYKNKNLKLARYQSLMFPIMMIIVGITQVIILGYGGNLVIDDKLTIGGLAQYFIYLNLLIWPIAAIGWITNVIQRASASALRLSESVFDNDEKEQSGANMDKDIESIEIQDLTFSFTGSKVIDNIKLEIPKGTSLGIIGQVGSGKTTLINLIAGLYYTYTGTIRFNDIDSKDFNIKSLRNQIAFVRQEPFLFSMSIIENLKLAGTNIEEEKIIEICKSVKLHEEILTFPDGYNTILGERGITLSGGQKQRLSLARALLRNPQILILDDSLSAVDTDTEKYILNSLESFRKNKITIFSAHRISNIRNFDKIIVLEKGSILESGTHNELIELGGFYNKMFNLQELETEISTY